MATLLNCTEPTAMFKMILAGIGFVSEWIFLREQVGGRGEAQLFQSFFPITDIAAYRLNLPRGQFI